MNQIIIFYLTHEPIILFFGYIGFMVSVISTITYLKKKNLDTWGKLFDHIFKKNKKSA